MIILGIDQATQVGYCVVSDKVGILESGSISFKVNMSRGESQGVMYLRFGLWLNEMIAKHKPDLLVHEEVIAKGKGKKDIAFGLLTKMQEAQALHGFDITYVHNATLKKFATGKGNAGKDEMELEALRFLGRETVDNNEADAVHIARWGLKQFTGKDVREGSTLEFLYR